MQTTEPVAELAPGVEAPKPPTLAQCHEVIDTLVQLVAEQQQEIAWLHERVTLNSKTSSKPPSSDGPGSPNRAQRRASPRKRGAQKVTPAVTARWWTNPRSTGSSTAPPRRSTSATPR